MIWFFASSSWFASLLLNLFWKIKIEMLGKPWVFAFLFKSHCYRVLCFLTSNLWAYPRARRRDYNKSFCCWNQQISTVSNTKSPPPQHGNKACSFCQLWSSKSSISYLEPRFWANRRWYPFACYFRALGSTLLYVPSVLLSEWSGLTFSIWVGCKILELINDFINI